MAVSIDQIENREYSVIPLAGGLDLAESKALVLPGTLQDAINYEVVSRGYTRGQGLLLYHGTHDRSVDNMWYIADLDANTTLTGANGFTLGGTVTWGTNSTGTCVYWYEDGVNNYKALGIIDVTGDAPAAGDTYVDSTESTELEVPRAPTDLVDATYPHDSTDVVGTVTDYLTFINGVNTSIAAETASTWPYFKPTIPGTGAITGGFQFKDKIYAARDYMGIGFIAGTDEIFVDDIINVGSFIGKVAKVELTDQSWEANNARGVLYLQPHDGGSNDEAVFDAVATGSAITVPLASGAATYHDGFNSNKGFLWEASASGWSLVDLGYTLRFHSGENAPNAQVAPLFLPATTEAAEAVQETGFMAVDAVDQVGSALEYTAWGNQDNIKVEDAATATVSLPVATAVDDPALSTLLLASLSDFVDAVDTKIIGVEVSIKLKDSGTGTSRMTSVRLVNNVTGEQYLSDRKGDIFTTTPTSLTTVTYGSQTDLWGMESLTAEQFNDGDIDIQIQASNWSTGSTVVVEIDYVAINVHYIARGQSVYFTGGIGASTSGDLYSFEVHDGYWITQEVVAEVLATGTVTLDSGAAGSVDGIVVNGIEIMSASEAFDTDLETTATNVASNITANTSSPNYAATSAGTIVTITAAAGTGEDTNYFAVSSTATTITTTDTHMADGADAIAQAGGDATGYMTLHNVVSPSTITAGLYIHDAPGGVAPPAEVIARTASDLERNMLPSEAELAAEGSKWETIEANFYANDEGKAIYGATGADSSFLFDVDDHFAYIRLPVDAAKDKPRHLAFHANHLALGLKSGHLLVSAIDVPNDFDMSGTATSWSFRDPITGVRPLAGNALGVMCRDSINTLLGTQAPISGATDPFHPKNVTPSTGAIEYSVANVMGPMYADYNGVTTMDTSDKFGDFDVGRLTVAIEQWTRDRVQNQTSSDLAPKGPVLAVPIRAKNQYRMYFEDGYILALYIGEPDKPAQPMFLHMEPTTKATTYVPTWLDSTILSTGRERVVMGDKNGNVWIVDGANGIQTASGLTELECYITTNPVNTGYPQGSHKTYDMTVMGDFMAAQTIETSVGYDYLDVTSTARTKIIGDYAATPVFDPLPDLTDVYVKAFTDGTSIKIETTMDGSKPHTLHTLLHRYSRKGSGRNNTQVPR